MGNSLKFSFFDKTYILFASCSFWPIKHRPMGNMTVGLGRRRTYRAVEDVDSMGESGRDRGLDGLSGEFQGLEGPVCKFNNLLEAWRESSQQRHFLFFCFPLSLSQLQPAPRTKLGWRPLLVVLLRPHTRPRLSCFLFCQLNAIRIVVSFLFFSFLSNSWADNISWLRKKFWKIVVLARGSLWLGWDVWWICEWGEIFLDLLLIGNKSIKAVLSWKITVFCQKCNDWK